MFFPTLYVVFITLSHIHVCYENKFATVVDLLIVLRGTFRWFALLNSQPRGKRSVLISSHRYIVYSQLCLYSSQKVARSLVQTRYLGENRLFYSHPFCVVTMQDLLNVSICRLVVQSSIFYPHALISRDHSFQID